MADKLWLQKHCSIFFLSGMSLSLISSVFSSILQKGSRVNSLCLLYRLKVSSLFFGVDKQGQKTWFTLLFNLYLSILYKTHVTSGPRLSIFFVKNNPEIPCYLIFQFEIQSPFKLLTKNGQLAKIVFLLNSSWRVGELTDTFLGVFDSLMLTLYKAQMHLKIVL